VGFTRQHPTSTGFRWPATVPYPVRKFGNTSFVSLFDSGISVSVYQDGCLPQSLIPTPGLYTCRDSQWYLKVKDKGALKCYVPVLFLFLQVVYDSGALLGKHWDVLWDAAPGLSLPSLY